MIKTVVRVSFIPCLLWLMRVPVLSTAALPIFVNPSRAIVALTPCSIPPFSVLTFPPSLSLLDTMTIGIKVFIPFVTPFRPTIALTAFSPFVSVFYAATMSIILLTPPANCTKNEIINMGTSLSGKLQKKML
jgi:hypothetical protein